MVALTGYGQENDRRRCLEAGFDAHLVKPVATPELEALLAPTENGAMDGPRSAQRRSCRS
jgi:CheY-like chemotaxis protein